MVQRMNTAESQAVRFRRQHFGELPLAVIEASFELRRFLTALGQAAPIPDDWR